MTTNELGNYIADTMFTPGGTAWAEGPYYRDDNVTVYQGDCLDILKLLGDNTIDSVCTDPPYALAFMGKAFDTFAGPTEYQGWCQSWAAECLRVLKPGGFMLAFGGTRTSHRLACAIEDAGFEIRDSIAWLYGSGFPKSLDVSKAIDRVALRAGMFDEFAKHFAKRRVASGLSQKAIAQHFPSKTGGLTGCVWNWENGTSVPTRAQWSILAPLLSLSDEWLPLIERVESERKVLSTKTITPSGDGSWAVAGGQYAAGEKVINTTAPATDAAKTWAGWGTALKPAMEIIVVARKPIQGSVAGNVLQHGTGALNIDGCRVTTTDNTARGAMSDDGAFGSKSQREHGYRPNYHKPNEKRTNGGDPAGRWPPNVVLDGEMADVLDKQSGITRCGGPTNSGGKGETGIYGTYGDETQSNRGHGDEGGASRFFPVFSSEAAAGEKWFIGHRRPHVLGATAWYGAYRTQAEAEAAKPAVVAYWQRRGGISEPHGYTFIERDDEACIDYGQQTVELIFPTFKYTPKAGALERPTADGIQHPTTKPVELMKWLIRLVVPPHGTLLDPFAGSGTTGEAAILEHKHAILIEREPTYMPLIKARLHKPIQQGFDFDVEEELF